MLRAARLRADAVSARVPQAGALPDPMLSFGLRSRPLNGFGTDEPMTMNTIGLSQTLPWPLDIMRETRELLREFLDVSNTLYAVRQGLQADVLQAQVAVASLTESITVVEQNRVAMAARLNALLGRGPERPVSALELPDPGAELPGLEALMAVAPERRPALRAARERVEAAESAYRAARRAVYPNVTLGADYAQRPQFPDMLSVSVGVSIPLWAGSRQLPMRDEARARRAAEEATELDLLNETYARVAEARAASDPPDTRWSGAASTSSCSAWRSG